MRQLPTGIVTFLFTDIEGSTRLAQQYPDDLLALLTRHHAILNDAVKANNGYVFQIIGDAFACAFFTAADALAAALMAQRALQHEAWRPAPVKVRMGIHTGMAQAGVTEEKAGGYVGHLTFTRVQRIMSVAHGEQVLISNASADLLRNTMPSGASLRDMGEHRLKGLDTPDHLWQLVSSDIRQNFVPLQTASVSAKNLPSKLTPLIGRDAEMTTLINLLTADNAPRLITITGMGGIGKTHFVQSLAAQVTPIFADGVVYVPLATVRTSNLVIPTIAQALELQDTGTKPILDQLVDHLHGKSALIVLDNFEQVIQAADQIAEILAHCSHIRVLVTSRISLNIAGEHQFTLPILQPIAAESLLISRSGIAPSTETLALLRAICKRLEGIPLAIELAAQQLKMLSPQELLGRLDAPLSALASRNPSTRQREYILRRTLDRSYELLTPSEQALFRQMGIFVGGCDFCTAFAVFAQGALAEDDHTASYVNQLKDQVEYDLFTLIDHNLLRREVREDGESRYTMHELLREYAREQLTMCDEFEAVSQHHTHYFVYAGEIFDAYQQRNTQTAKSSIEGVRQRHPVLLSLLQAGLGNRLVNPADKELRLQNWVEDNLSNIRILSEWSKKPRLLRARGQVHEKMGDFDSAHADYEQALNQAHQQADQHSEWQSLIDLGFLWSSRDYGQTGVYFQQALALARALNDERLLAKTLNRVGNWHMNIEQSYQALDYHNEAQRLFEKIKDTDGLDDTLDLQAMTFFMCGDEVNARSKWLQVVSNFKSKNKKRQLPIPLSMLAISSYSFQMDVQAMSQTLPETAENFGQEAIKIARQNQHLSDEAFSNTAMGYYYESFGRYDAALKNFHIALDIAESINHRQWQTTVHIGMGVLYTQTLHWEKAKEYFTLAYENATTLGSPSWVRHCVARFIPLEIYKNNFAGAYELFNQLNLPDAPDTKYTLAHRQCLGAKAELLLADHKPNDALALVEHLIATEPYVRQEVIPRLWYLRGKCLFALNHYAESENALIAALKKCEQYDLLPLMWRIHLELGKLGQKCKSTEYVENAFSQMRNLVSTIAQQTPPSMSSIFTQRALALI
jgi:predicted ATPase/class 3 adenylate cyclase/Tfp pilus assembly protein PilF